MTHLLPEFSLDRWDKPGCLKKREGKTVNRGYLEGNKCNKGQYMYKLVTDSKTSNAGHNKLQYMKT